MGEERERGERVRRERDKSDTCDCESSCKGKRTQSPHLLGTIFGSELQHSQGTQRGDDQTKENHRSGTVRTEGPDPVEEVLHGRVDLVADGLATAPLPRGGLAVTIAVCLTSEGGSSLPDSPGGRRRRTKIEFQDECCRCSRES
jgi:hypothetical protein